MKSSELCGRLPSRPLESPLICQGPPGERPAFSGAGRPPTRALPSRVAGCCLKYLLFPSLALEGGIPHPPLIFCALMCPLGMHVIRVS